MKDLSPLNKKNENDYHVPISFKRPVAGNVINLSSLKDSHYSPKSKETDNYLESTKSTEKLDSIQREAQELRIKQLALLGELQREKRKREEEERKIYDRKKLYEKDILKKDEKMDKLNQKIKELEMEKKTLDNECLKHIKEKEALRDQIANLKEEISKKEEYIQSEDKSNLRPIIDEYNRIIESLKKEKDQIISELKEELKNKEEQLKHCSLELQQHEEELQNIRPSHQEWIRYKQLLEKKEQQYEIESQKYKAHIQSLLAEKENLIESFNKAMNEVHEQILERENRKNENMSLLEQSNTQLLEENRLLQEQFRYQMKNKEKEMEELRKALHQARLHNPEFVEQDIFNINKEIRHCIGDIRTLAKLIASELPNAESGKAEKNPQIQQGNTHSTALHNAIILHKEIEQLKALLTEQYSVYLSRSINDCATQ